MADTQFMKDAKRKGGCQFYLIVIGVIFPFLINVYLGVGVLVLGLIIIIYKSKNGKEKKSQEAINFSNLIKTQEEYRISNGVKAPWCRDRYYGGHPLMDSNKVICGSMVYIWRDKECLYFLNNNMENSVGKFSIPINNIICYYRGGEVHNEMHIEGGGGGGVSIGGAIVGGIIAGNAGAIIGGRKEISPITTRNIKVDNTRTIIEFNYNNKLNRVTLDDGNCTYSTFFLTQIPDKEKKEVMDLKNNSSETSLELIKKLSDLKEQGILTENEFNDKKKILLDKIK